MMLTCMICSTMFLDNTYSPCHRASRGSHHQIHLRNLCEHQGTVLKNVSCLSSCAGMRELTHPNLSQFRHSFAMVRTALLVRLCVNVPQGGSESRSAFVQSQSMVCVTDI